MGGVHRTERLLLRRWTDADLVPFAALNADPEVMKHFPAPLSRADSDALARHADTFLRENGWGLWAVEVSDDGRFAGFTGLTPVRPSLPFAPAIEVGWRLARWAWGRGYATEAATAALRIAFGDLDLDEVVSFTAATNVRSAAVMQRIGMTRNPADDFDHPDLPVRSSLRPHVLYRIARADPR
jgi:RimJ/RimL family protein N-acetyltransferase